MSKGLEYISNVERIIQEIKETQMQSLYGAAKVISEALKDDKMIYVFEVAILICWQKRFSTVQEGLQEYTQYWMKG